MDIETLQDPSVEYDLPRGQLTASQAERLKKEALQARDLFAKQESTFFKDDRDHYYLLSTR